MTGIDTGRFADSNGPEPASAKKPSKGGAVLTWFDDRLGLASLAKKQVRKVFPDHWSFMLGEIALWSFVVLLLTGVFLTLWFNPSMASVDYHGSYDQWRGVHMSAAFASTLEISFDVRGGLLMRQMHHWAAMIFIGAMFVHMIRVFCTGAFRKPRELNWVIGSLILLLAILAGFSGYSLPDDLLSGTGMRIADGIVKATPILGSYMSFFMFGGEYPGAIIISRLYMVHILLIPALILALIGAHMLLLVYHKHTQWAGPGRTEKNVVGYPLMPVYMAKAGGFFFMVFGVIALMGGTLGMNPVWMYGPYDPSKVTAGSQPDWYMGFAEGLLRIMPGWETHIWGHTISWNVLVPAQLVAMAIFVVFVAWPFIEAWVSGDKREHHLLQRPRNAPTRTGFLVAMMTLYGLLWAAGGNDILATQLHLSLNSITYFMRVAVFVLPVIAFIVTRRWCIALQRHDNEMILHGYETGIIMRSAEGGYSEKHLPLSEDKVYALTARNRDEIYTPGAETDANGVEGGTKRSQRVRARLSEAMYGHNVQKPTREELEEGHHHSDHETELQSGLDHPASGHEFDGHHQHDADDMPLRGGH